MSKTCPPIFSTAAETLEKFCAIRSSNAMRSSFFFPTPRCLAVLNAGDSDPIWHVSHHSERCESKAGTDLLDIILPKDFVCTFPPSSFTPSGLCWCKS
ncbi:Cyclase-associated protein [Actinidia chinensis var. chinensis]|uniref:Cyclase-associated protein n=1 Tax=Actinidia chinensis var. chinensis TaxID=1590841 RepID=A0A2R6PCQ3_ACTCC|nr:Cyclase-associated protein [Actinidia chinensis var. chinensis]